MKHQYHSTTNANIIIRELRQLNNEKPNSTLTIGDRFIYKRMPLFQDLGPYRFVGYDKDPEYILGQTESGGIFKYKLDNVVKVN